jgi:hypothetical protein
MGVSPHEFQHGVLEQVEGVFLASGGDLGHAKGAALDGFEKLLHNLSVLPQAMELRSI